MRMKFPSSLWIRILSIALSSQTIFVTGAARNEDEFQRSSFYTNEQGVGVDVERTVPDKSLMKKPYEGRVVENNIVKDSRSADSLHPDYSANNNEGDNAAEVKSVRQNRKQVNKRFTYSDRASNSNPEQTDNENHFRIPRERVKFIDGLDYQDRMDNDKNSFILSREETRGLRQARKSYSESGSNTNWKWGFKRKQVKNEHGTKDAAVYGSHHNSYKHKDVAFGRSQQSDVMARGGHSIGEMLDNENYSGPRQNVMPANMKLVEQKNARYDTHQQAYQRQDVLEEHIHQGVAQQRPEAISRPDFVARQDAAIPDSVARQDTVGRPVANTHGSSQDVSYSKTNNAYRPENAPSSYNWDAGNPRIYNAPKFDMRKANGVGNASPQVESSKEIDNSIIEKADNSLRVDIPQMESRRASNIQLEPNKLDGGQPYEEPRIESLPRMDEQKIDEVSRIDHQRTNEVGSKMEEQGVESIPPEGMYENSHLKSNYVPCCQKHENARLEALHGLDNQQMGCQRMGNAQRIDNPSVANNGWKDDGSQGIANAQKMKQTQRNLNMINNMVAPPRSNIHRLDSTAGRGGGGMREEEIRYLVFTPAEFSPLTLRTVLGESEKPRSQGIPYCTLEEYELESASLRGKPFENFQDRQMQYRGKGYVNDMITRRKRKDRKKFPIRQPRKCQSVQMPVHYCTASTTVTNGLYGLVVQTEPVDPYAGCTTRCYVDALTMSTCILDENVGIGARSTPSKWLEEMRGHNPIISQFDNAVYTTCVPPCMLSPHPSKGRGHQGPFPTALVARMLKPNPNQTPDIALLSDILKNIVHSQSSTPVVNHVKRETPEEIQEQKIIEKYLTSLMEQQHNRSKSQHRERNSYRGGVWLGKLLEELAENKLKSRMRMVKNQPTKNEERPLKMSNAK